MKTWHNNGERWYCDNRSLWKRFRQAVICFGGWENPNRTGWQFRLRDGHGPSLWMDAYPVTILRRLTLYGWGWDLKLKCGYLVCSREPSRDGKRYRQIYFSPNGIPSRATAWLWRPPHDVLAMTAEADAEATKRLRAMGIGE